MVFSVSFYSFIVYPNTMLDRPIQSFILMESEIDIPWYSLTIAVHTVQPSTDHLLSQKLLSDVENIMYTSTCLLEYFMCCIQTCISYIRALLIKREFIKHFFFLNGQLYVHPWEILIPIAVKEKRTTLLGRILPRQKPKEIEGAISVLVKASCKSDFRSFTRCRHTTQPGCSFSGIAIYMSSKKLSSLSYFIGDS